MTKLYIATEEVIITYTYEQDIEGTEKVIAIDDATEKTIGADSGTEKVMPSTFITDSATIVPDADLSPVEWELTGDTSHYSAVANSVDSPDDNKYITAVGALTSPVITPDADLSPTDWTLTGSTHYGALTNGYDTEYITAVGATEAVSWEHGRGDSEYVGNNTNNLAGVALIQTVDADFTATKIKFRAWVKYSDVAVEVRAYLNTTGTRIDTLPHANLTLIGSNTWGVGTFNTDINGFETLELDAATSIENGDIIQLFMSALDMGSAPPYRTLDPSDGFGVAVWSVDYSPPDRQRFLYNNSAPDPWNATWSSSFYISGGWGTPLRFINETVFSGLDHLRLSDSPSDLSTLIAIHVDGRGRWTGTGTQEATIKFYHTSGTVLVGTATVDIGAGTENTWYDAARETITGLSLTKVQTDDLSIKIEPVWGDTGTIDLSEIGIYFVYTESDADVDHLRLGDTPSDVLTVTSIKSRSRALWGGAGSSNTFTVKLYHTSGTVLLGTFTFVADGTEAVFTDTDWETISGISLTKTLADDMSIKLEASLGADVAELISVSEIEFICTYIVDQADYEKTMAADSGTEKVMAAVAA